MGVYIKDMTMPTRCGRCDMCFKTPITTYTCCITGADIDNLGEMMEDCPLVPVPPHGRLGDLDALAQQVEHERFHHTHTDGLAARHHVAEYGHFLNAISDAPTIIPEDQIAHIPAVEEVDRKHVSMALETSPGNRIRSMSNYELAEFLSNIVDHCFTLGMNQKTEAFPCDADCAMYECCCGPYMSVEQWLEGTPDKELEEYFRRVDGTSAVI